MKKKILSIGLILGLIITLIPPFGVSVKAENDTGMFAVKFGYAQVFDCYRSGSNPVSVYNFSQPYVAPYTNRVRVDFGSNKDRYIKVCATATDGRYDLKLYEANGTFVQDIASNGPVTYLLKDNPGFLYVDGRSDTGYYFAYGKGYNYGESEKLMPNPNGQAKNADLLRISGPIGILKPGDTSEVSISDIIDTEVDIVFEKTAPADVKISIEPDKEVLGVTLDGTEIINSGCQVTPGEVVISQSQIANLPNGTHTIIISYQDGSDKSVQLSVMDYNEKTVKKNVPIFKMNKVMGVKSKFTLNLVGVTDTAKVTFESSNKKVATVNKTGVIIGKKKGNCVISGNVIQNGSFYKVKVSITVKKKMKIYNLKPVALSKLSGNLPEFNVYKLVNKGKRAKLEFASVTKDAKIKYTAKDKKVATVSAKGVIQGKKKGFTVVTASISQNGKKYITRVFVRVDDGTKNKQTSKYLK